MHVVVLALLTYSFKGGTPSAFADSLSDHASSPVCVALDTDDVSALRIDYESRSELARRLAKELVLDLADAKRFGFGPRAYSDAVFMPAFRSEYWSRFPSGKYRLERSSSDVVLKPPKEPGYLSMSDVSALPWSKKTIVHPFLATYRCAVAGRGTEEAYLRVIAAAVGGKLAMRRDAYEIELDFATVRRRWIERYKRSMAADRSFNNTASSEFAIEALTQAPDSVIRAALAKEGGRAHYEIPKTSSLRAAAEKKIEAGRRLARGEGGSSLGADRLSLIDFDKPWSAELMASGAVSLRMASKDGRGSIHF